MKYSRYNTVLSIVDNVVILYNSLSDKFLFLKREFWETIKDDPNKDTEYLKDFIEGGFIVSNETNELQLYKNKVFKIEHDQTNAHLIVNPTVNCNFNCWYCYENHSPSKMSTDIIERIFNLIKTICGKSKSLTISFFGGEPFLYYHEVIIPIVKYAWNITREKGLYFSCNFTTNGSLLSIKRINELKRFNFNFAQITLDGDEKNHNKTRFFKNGRESYKTIINNIKDLANKQIRVTLRINYTHKNIQSIINIPHDLKNLSSSAKKNIFVSFHKVWQEAEIPPLYIEKAVKSFVNCGFTVSEQMFGEYCYGDLRNSIVINYNGDVFKCTAIDFANASRDGYLNSDG